MFSIFSKKEEKVIFKEPYRPSWEESSRQWEQAHITRKKAFESSKHDLGSNTLPRVYD